MTTQKEAAVKINWEDKWKQGTLEMSFNRISTEKSIHFCSLSWDWETKILTHSKSKDCTDGEMRVKNEIEWRQSYARKGAEMTSIIEKNVQWRPKRTRDWLWIST